MNHVVGRDRERAEIAEFLATARVRPAVLTIEGEAGIGKTVLMHHAIDAARATGAAVLLTSPGQQEAALTFTGLTDLLAPVAQARIDELPPPQRDALNAATLRTGPHGAAPDERAIRTGLSSLIMALDATAPLVIAIDDSQWLDASTVAALDFALRRMGGPIGVIIGRRRPSGGSEIGDALRPDVWRAELVLTGLSLGATFVLVRETLGIALPRIRLNRVWEASQGNPLYALELVRALHSRDPDLVSSGLSLPERLRRLLAERLGTLSPAARHACLTVALASRLTTDAIARLNLDPGATEAIDAGVLVAETGRIRFTHPLLASAAAELAADSERSRVHARLADVVAGDEERARHLALADERPSPATAAALSAAAEAAQSRGSISSALELARLAHDRTPETSVEDLWRRRLTLATLLFRAGETESATTLLADRDRSCPPGQLRAQVELLLVDVMFQTAGSDEAATAARRALEHARDDVDLRARALLSLSIVEGAHQTPHATEARALLEAQPNPNPELLAWAIIEQISGACLAGNGVDRGELDRAIALERSIGRWRSDFQVATIYPVILRWIDECEEALDALDALGTLADDEGDESLTPYILGHTASALIALGRFPAAADVAERHLSHAEATRQGGQRLQALQMCAHAALFLGALDRATAQASEVLEAAIQVNDTWVIAGVSGILGAAELWRGRPEPARDHLDRWHSATAEAGVAEPGVWRFHADHVEALLACGDREVAQRRTDDLRAAAERAGRGSALAMAHRCDAMLSAHDGDLRGALDHVDGVLQYDAKAVNDFERGRALLLRGTVHRRLKEKSAARTALRAARDGFQATGAAGWVVVTDGEIDRIGRPSSDPFTLTDTERRVAELAAQGLTNREVAERAFMSAKTVEANLAKVYRKLGIRSRAELGACMARSVP